MKTTYFLTAFFALFLCISVSAQLAVRGTSFVYSDDTVVYVTDDVNIQTNAKIYLRNEAQLLQGNGTTGNSGQGEISVYQTGNVNRWAYNYWCSPVGNVDANNNTNTNARVDLIDDPFLWTTSTIDSQDANFTSAWDGIPADDILNISHTTSSRWLYTFVTSDQYAEWIYVGDNGAIAPGLGFTMKGTSANPIVAQTYDFRGKPNNGTISNNVVDDQSTLVGNPYPSALDSAAFIHDTNNATTITGTLEFWEHDTTVESHLVADYIGGYYQFTISSDGSIITDTPAPFITYDEFDNIALTGSSGTKFARRYIPIGQGFMVEGITPTTSSVRTTNDMRAYAKVSGTESIFFRPENATESQSVPTTPNDTNPIEYQANGLVIVPDNYMRFRVNVDFEVQNTAYTKQLILNFNDNATMGFDYGLELTKTSHQDSDAYFMFNNQSYTGQAFPFTTDLVIPLTIDIEEAQPLRFRIFDIQNFDDNQEIFLHDIPNNLYVDLRNQDYEINIQPGNYSNRFEIVFTDQNLLSIIDEDVNSLTVMQDNANHQLTILNPNGIDITSVELFDVTGKRVIHFETPNTETRYTISTMDLNDAVYIVNLKSTANTIQAEKIIVKN